MSGHASVSIAVLGYLFTTGENLRRCMSIHITSTAAANSLKSHMTFLILPIYFLHCIQSQASIGRFSPSAHGTRRSVVRVAACYHFRCADCPAPISLDAYISRIMVFRIVAQIYLCVVIRDGVRCLAPSIHGSHGSVRVVQCYIQNVI